MTLPTFLIIGAAKSGTSSVFAYLGQHPDVFISPAKEPNYFALADRQVCYEGPGDEIVNRASVTTLEKYQALFRGVQGHSAVGEASTLYLYSPSSAPAICRHQPGMKLIAILRDPAERAYSSYLHLRRDGREPCESFEAALDQEAARIAGRWEHLWHYTRLGFYHEQVERYCALFPRQQIGVWLYDDLVADPHLVMRQIFAFLGVDPRFEPDMSVKHKVAGTPRSATLHGMLTRRNLAKALAQRVLPTQVKGRLYGALMQRNIVEDRPAMRPETRERLQSLYRDDITHLSLLLERDLSTWLRSPEPAGTVAGGSR